ncbi:MULTISPECIES: rhomboid family intramembrane serine protease [unclassified Mucilaginibacter]|uniref:rhomboid family intramembrane serine protease n=1 Tax=unclassified Mucilaginibacter TaxID=2617802 RepID=UPI002AC97306|nr:MULTISPECIES: rhomboid family intramembrane serine protease [unclassified Mucilaginibacter]MEB0261635.1 rhomboid family intramembrane serine protease [Mucilaginibacter sp. 10I4]MEB0278500.1 rhomboid family intramembrane serine protease [Mucilaginibacter sp. 10B2]MEB0300720.1 rhomboid family intramembrane serine protease [Mucilaginibacter sp. 5C4]WPX23544.1 rhomboid family intramembrane serine protease [Mucilaginibacter sp. 5C4]
MQSPFANMPPVTKNLLVINILFFIATYALAKVIDLNALFAAYYPLSPAFRPWQIITYMFMHGGLTHILFNMFALYSFGPMLEYTLGSKKFFNYYFITGIGAYVLYMVVQAVQIHTLTGSFSIPHPEIEASYFNYGGPENAQKLYGFMNFPMLGASGAIFGILVGFAMLFPNLEMMIMFIPVPIKAKYVVIGYIAIELFTGIGRFAGDNVAHFAHLGGALFGFLLIKLWGIKRPNNFY